MKCRIEKGRLIWNYQGEEVCLEACGFECIRVRASFKLPVDKSLDFNLDCRKDVPVKICLKLVGEQHAVGANEAAQEMVVEWPGQDFCKETFAAEEAKFECGKSKAVVRHPGQITFFYDGKQILKEEWIDETCQMPPYQKAREYKGISSGSFQIQAYFHSNKGEALYGMGQESRDCLNLKGCTVDLCQKNTKCTIPFYVSSLGYGFLWNNPAIGRAELTNNRFLWEAKMARQLDYIVVGGKTPKKILEHYTEITGRIPKYPDWILGLWQSKLRYRTQQEVLAAAREYNKRNIPLSVLVIDYFHWPQQGDWKFDERYFPNPKQMNEELEQAGIHLMVSVWPTVDPRSENYKLLSEEGFLLSAERGPDVFFMCRGAQTYMDMTCKGAGQMLYQKLKQNYGIYGITSFWLDEAEPEIYPYDYGNMRLEAGNGLQVSCNYPYMYNESIENALLDDGVWKKDMTKETDGIILARSGWIGSQRLRSVIWSGDVPSTFDSLKRQIMAGLQMSMCGIVFWTTDIGGFYGGDPQQDEFRELMIRWFQFAAFCPILRMHGYRKPYEEKGGMDDMSGECSSGGPNELWSFGDEAYKIMLDYLGIRKKMLPYIKQQLHLAEETGTPLMRPLFYDFPEDSLVHDIGDEYMFGSRILAAPVLEYKARSRNVYLPEGRWISALTGERLQGNRTITVEAPLDKMPVFYRGV